MSKKVFDNLCQRLIKHAPKEALMCSMGLFGEAKVPDCLKKQQDMKKQDQE